MDALIERLEKATGPDRELDALLATVLDSSLVVSNVGFAGYVKLSEIDFDVPAREYTESIDAALLLVPEGFEPHQIAFPHGVGRTYAFEIFPPPGHPEWSRGSICRRGATAPLAICIAALHARQSAPPREL